MESSGKAKIHLLRPGGSFSSKLKKKRKREAAEGGAGKKKKKLEEDDSEVVNDYKTEAWWDLENVPLPRNFRACRVYEMILKNLAERGFTGPVNVTAVVAYKDSYVPQCLRNIQVHVVEKMNRPEGSNKDQTADDGIRARVKKWLEAGHQQHNVMLITGDNGFADLFAEVIAAGHTTMVVFQKNVNQPKSSVAISESAEYYWDDWRSFLRRQSKAEERERLAKEKKQRQRTRERERRGRGRKRRRKRRRGLRVPPVGVGLDSRYDVDGAHRFCSSLTYRTSLFTFSSSFSTKPYVEEKQRSVISRY